MQLSPDGKLLAHSDWTTNTIRLKELATDRAIWAIKRGKAESITRFAFSADNKTL
jgi:hypothetical protein